MLVSSARRYEILKRLLPFTTDISCRSRLAKLNENLTALEQRVECIEAKVTLKRNLLIKSRLIYKLYQMFATPFFIKMFAMHGCFMQISPVSFVH